METLREYREAVQQLAERAEVHAIPITVKYNVKPVVAEIQAHLYTNGSVAEATIRINPTMRKFPVEYNIFVLAHELVHLVFHTYGITFSNNKAEELHCDFLGALLVKDLIGKENIIAGELFASLSSKETNTDTNQLFPHHPTWQQRADIINIAKHSEVCYTQFIDKLIEEKVLRRVS